MAAIASSMPELGSPAKSFCLPSENGKSLELQTFHGKGFLLLFICNHCPYVIHIAPKLSEIGALCKEKGLGCLAINSNDITKYPQDAPDKMASFAKEYKLNFPYLFDETQETARLYQAACTPDIFLYDQNHKLYYRGQFDASRPGSTEPVTGEDLKQAIKGLTEGKKSPTNQKPSMGCNIKWA